MDKKRIEPLYENKTVVISFPFESDNVFVRTGTNKSSWNSAISSFVECLQFVTTRNYIQLTNEKKRDKIGDFIDDLKTSYIDYCVKNDDKNITNKYVELFKKQISEFYSFVRDGEHCERFEKIIKDKKDMDIFEVLIEILPYSSFRKVYDSNSYEKFLEKIRGELYNNILKVDKNAKGDKIYKLIDKYVSMIKYFSESSKNLLRKNVRMDGELIKYASKYVQKNIHLVDPYSRLVSKTYENNNDLNIILLEFNGNYEIVGELGENNRIKREFSLTDELIKKLLKKDDKKSYSNSYRTESELSNTQSTKEEDYEESYLTEESSTD
jgi:hypothetical protein